MNNDRGRRKADGQGRNKGKFCSNKSFGQGQGRNCSYGKNSSVDGSRPQQSIIATIFDGLDRVLDRSRKTIGLLSGKADRSPYSPELENQAPTAELPDSPDGKTKKNMAQLTNKK